MTFGFGPNEEPRVRPFGRAVSAGLATAAGALDSVEVVTFADCDGIIGASSTGPVTNVHATHELRREWIRPVIDPVARLLRAAEAFGDAVAELDILLSR